MSRQAAHYFELILYKTYSDLKAEAARGYLGVFWWVLEPILYLSVFYVVFSVIRHRNEGDFIPFVLVGLVVWKWFASTVTQGAKSISNGAGLMNQIYLPKYIFPGVVGFTNLAKFLIVFAILLAFLFIYGISPSVSWLSIPLLVIMQLTMLLAVAGILAAVTPFFPDINQIISNLLMLLFFLSGVIFDISKAPEGIKSFLYLNPMVCLIENYRAVLINGQMPDWTSLTILFLFSVVGLALAKLLMDRYDRVYPRILVR